MGFIALALGAITPFFIIKACRATVKDEADLFYGVIVYQHRGLPLLRISSYLTAKNTEENEK